MKLALALLLVATTSARADEDTSEAQKLFDAGRELLDAGKTDEACDKFELSIAKDPRAVGTLLNLGLCNERRGKVATALRLFQEAFDRAREAQLEQHQAAAQDHITKLVAQVPVLVIKVAAPVAGESVFVDDVGVKDKRELQLDPGPHRIVATAPGRLPFEKSLPIAAGSRATVEIPALEVPKPIIVGTSSRRVVGKVATIAGGGVLLVGVGLAVYGYRAYHAEFDSGHCQTLDGQRLCDATGQDGATRGRNLATAGSILGGVGVASAFVGAIVWFTAPSDGSPALAPAATSDSVSLVWSGRF